VQANGRLSKLWVRAAVFNTFISEVIMNQEIKDLEKSVELKEQEILLLCDVIASKMEELEAFKIKLNDLWEGVK
jgi:hypothetical protein